MSPEEPVRLTWELRKNWLYIKKTTQLKSKQLKVKKQQLQHQVKKTNSKFSQVLDLKQYLPKDERASLNFNDNYLKRVASSCLNFATIFL